MMAQYRKKPVVIEAVQWFPNSGIFHAGIWCDPNGPDAGKPYVITAHNQRAYLAPGDWIIPEPKAGQFYPCKSDIFAATYDPVVSVDPTGVSAPINSIGGPADVPVDMAARDERFRKELESLLNSHSRENGSNTPDFILAQFLCGVLAAWDAAVMRRSEWYGGKDRIGG